MMDLSLNHWCRIRMNKFLSGAEVVGFGLGKKYELVVIVLCFNQSRYVKEAVNSVIAQDWSESWHIIVHDDASTDESAIEIRKLVEYHSTKITAILQSHNRYSSAFNIPIELQRLVDAEFIARLDADDYFITPKKLREQVAILAKSPEIVLVSHPYLIINESGIPNVKIVFGRKLEISRYQMFLGNPIATPTAMYRSIAAAEMPAKLSGSRIQDWPFWVILAMKGRVSYLRGLESGYRVHAENSFAGRSNTEFKADNLMAHRTLIEYLGTRSSLLLRVLYAQALCNFKLDQISFGKATVVSNKIKAFLMGHKKIKVQKS